MMLLVDYFMDYLCEISLWKGNKTKNYISVFVTLTLVLMFVNGPAIKINVIMKITAVTRTDNLYKYRTTVSRRGCKHVLQDHTCLLVYCQLKVKSCREQSCNSNYV